MPPMGPPGRKNDFKKPKNAKQTFTRILKYMGKNKLFLIVVFIMLILSTVCNIAASYCLKPILNDVAAAIKAGTFMDEGIKTLVKNLIKLSILYVGASLFSFAQSKIMVTLAYKTTNLIRKDLFDHMQTLPLRFFDSKTHGEIMSRFTNDADNVQLALEQNPDLILLDLMLPGIDGYQVCREIRSKAATPIIMLSAKSEVFDKVLGLELGADDYIMKPFDPKEMVARVRAVLRRYQVGQQNDTSVEKTKCAEFDGLTINLTNYSVVCDGHPVDMPPKELELLYCLAASPNQVFTREQLLDRIWGYEYIGDTRTVDVHIKRLREKIKDHNGWSLSTVWGIGYKFEVK